MANILKRKTTESGQDEEGDSVHPQSKIPCLDLTCTTESNCYCSKEWMNGKGINSHTHLSKKDLSCCYGLLLNKEIASQLLIRCEDELSYYKGDLARVKIFGKWCNIPRKQVSFGDSGTHYTFSGVTLPALPWPTFLSELRDRISAIADCRFNFVLLNRYKDGEDYMGEHKDDEKDLDPKAPIASLSLGATRDFVFKHQSVKHKKQSKGDQVRPELSTTTIELKHGCLLFMNHPTNKYWYHSLPKRKKVDTVRVNMTFRKLLV